MISRSVIREYPALAWLKYIVTQLLVYLVYLFFLYKGLSRTLELLETMGPSSPSMPKPIAILHHGPPSSPLAHKRRRLASGEAQFIPFTPPGSPLPRTPFCFAPSSGEAINDEADVMLSPLTLADREQYSKRMLHMESHKKRQEYVAQEQNDKGTKDSYARHIAAYQLWWDHTYQPPLLHSDTSRERLPAFPITAGKAMMFLDYESTRPKVNHSILFLFC